jgi:hypothetical protein
MYETVFLVTEKHFEFWPGALGITLSCVTLLLGYLLGRRKPVLWRTTLGICFFGLTLSIFVLTVMYLDFRNLRNAYLGGDYIVVEGPVVHFRPMGERGDEKESFSVGSASFEYSPNYLTPGFNQPAYRGGPIREGLWVRVTHHHGVILKLEIKKPPEPAN